MPKRHQQRPAKERVGRNNPKKSTVITTGTYKKPETYEEQAAEHKDPGKIAQYEKVPPALDIPPGVTRQGDSQEMEELGERRSGSDSNANKHPKGSRLHESAQREPHPQHEYLSSYDTEDLRPDNFAGGN